MDVICAALELNRRSLAAAPAEAETVESKDNSTARRHTDDLVFQLCVRLSLAYTRAVASATNTTPSDSNKLRDQRGRALTGLLAHGAATQPITRYLVWTDLAALPAPSPSPPVRGVPADTPLSLSDVSLTEARRRAHKSVPHWVRSVLWEAQQASTVSGPASASSVSGCASTAAVHAYTRHCALLPPGAVRTGRLLTASALPPLMWLASLLEDHDARATLLHALLQEPEAAVPEDDAPSLGASVEWQDCQALLERPLLRAVPHSSCWQWLAAALPCGFEARLHAHIFFPLAAFYVDAPLSTGDGIERMDGPRFRCLARALVSRSFTRTAFTSVPEPAEVLRHAALRSGRTPLARASAEEDEGETTGLDNVEHTTEAGHEGLATAIASCFLSHAMSCGARHLQGLPDDGQDAAVASLPSSPPSPSSPTSLPPLPASFTRVLRCVEKDGHCYAAQNTPAPSTDTAGVSSTRTSADLREAHRALVAALLLLATSGESDTALYLRSLFHPLQDTLAASLEGTDDDSATDTARRRAYRLLSSSSCSLASAEGTAPASTLPWVPSTLLTAPTAALASEAALPYLAHDPAPFFVPSSLSETRSAEDDAHAHLIALLASSSLSSLSLSSLPSGVPCSPAWLRSPFRSTVAMTAALLRHPWVQLSALEQIWSLCTALTALGPSTSAASVTAPDLREVLVGRLRTLYDVYAHSMVEAGVGGTGTVTTSPVKRHVETDTPEPPPAPHAGEVKHEDGVHNEADSVAIRAPPLPPPTTTNEVTSGTAPRRRLKLFSRTDGAAPPPPPRRSLALVKRARDDDDDRADPLDPPSHPTEEAVLPFDEPVLQWCADVPSTLSSSSASRDDFALGSVLVETLLSFTRIVQEPLFDVLDALDEAHTRLTAAEEGAVEPPVALPRLRLSLAIPVCAEQLRRLASAQLVQRLPGTDRMQPLGTALSETLGVLLGTLISYFVYRWTGLLAQRVSPSSPASAVELCAEGVLRLQRLTRPLLGGWPEASRAQLNYPPLSTHLLPQLLSGPCRASASLDTDKTAAVSPWEQWRCFLEEQNIVQSQP